jgi:hypothetical protein
MARAAFLGEVGHQVQHQGDVGPVALEPAFLLDRHQVGLGQVLEVEGDVVGGEVEGGGNFAGHHSVRPAADQVAVDLQAGAGSEGVEHLGRGGGVHVSRLQEILN